MAARSYLNRRPVWATMIGAVLSLFLGLALAQKATTDDLGGADRYLARVSTDKPIYRPGETVFVRGVLLHAASHTPLKSKNSVNSLIEIRGPKGDIVASGYARSGDSVIGFKWDVPAEQPGGEYRIKFIFPWHGYAPAERKFDIRAYRAPRLKSQIVFLRDGYGPGDEVGATLHVERAEGGFPAGAKVTAIARVDGVEVRKVMASVGPKGNCAVSFKLPKQIARGEGSLAMIIEDGGVVETATKTIPILLQTIDLTMYPEGGDLVAGLPSRVYLEAKTPLKKPADLAGVIVDAAGTEVVKFRTSHEGRGRFDITPVKGGKYTLRITEPSGILTTYPLPAVKDSGAIISTVDEMSGKGEHVRLKVASTKAAKLTVTLSKREVEVSSVTTSFKPGLVSRIFLTPPKSADGVLVATVWDEDGKPLAERLVYRQPMESLRISIKADKDSYVPGGKATLTVKATSESGKPVSAVVGITVTDDTVLEMIEKREQAPRLPVMVLLEDEVRELSDAHVYLDPDNPKAPLALDLLLGTQGWRRFAFMDAADFISKNGDRARRVLALRIVARREAEALDEREAATEQREGKEEGEVVPRDAAAKPVEKALKLADAGPDIAKAKASAKPVPVIAGPPPAPEEEPKALRDLREELAKEVHELSKVRRKLASAVAEANQEAAENTFLENRERAARVRSDFIAVRIYAHPVRPNRRPGERVDFTETLYWHAGIRTDAKTGEARVSFSLNDSVTTFRVFADGFSDRGALGQGTGSIESIEPFYVEPKLPLEVTSGDVILLPISIVSGIGSDLPDSSLTLTAGRGIEVAFVAPFALRANARERRIVKVSIGTHTGLSDFVVHAKAGPYSDKVIRKLRVAPLGFPVEIASGGTLETGSAVTKSITIPASVVRGSVSTSIAVYPTPLANLTQALSRLLREPNGCFEQTSSTTYPLVMAQQYFMSHRGVDPSLVQRSRVLLDKGYKRLISFECPQRGYEWFAGDPGHEALTAYGLLEFFDMSQVREVDSEMLSRTRQWLAKSRDGKGGFSRKRRALHTWIVDRDCSNAYILWSLFESGGGKGFEPEIQSLKTAALNSRNSYVHALAANVMSLAGEKGAAKKLMDCLAGSQTKDGWIDGATASIVGSGGEALRIETASLALLAWLREPAYAGAVEKSIRYLSESCKGGRFGSTQSTVLALRAIVAYDKARSQPAAKGSIQLFVDGRNVGAPVPFDEKTQGVIKLPDIGEVFEPGDHKIQLKMADGAIMPYSLAINYHSLTPASAKECQVGVKVRLSDTNVTEGAITEANVTVTNLSKQPVPMTVAIIGVPGGLEPRHDQLKELVKSGKIDAYEVIGREVVLYWRSLRAEQKSELPVSLVAAVPGTYTGPASRAYLYYTDEFKQWQDGMKVTIMPRLEK
jgi:hypothetical protein